jgi:hypothetical protein
MTRTTTCLPLLVLAAGCGVTGAEPPLEPVPLPFLVSDYFSPDGHWGDGRTRGAVQIEKSCPARAPGAGGDCYTVTYTPRDLRHVGINWQYPHNNWGTEPGLRVAAGARGVRFQARGERGGELAAFGAGQVGTRNPYDDGFSVGPLDVDLGKDWASFEIPMRGQDYQVPGGVVAAFTLKIDAPEGQDRVVIYIDDVRWRP